MALVFLGLGCKSPEQMIAEKITEKAVEDATGGKVDLNFQNDGYTLETEQGTITAEQKLPANFPKYIPIYPGSRVATATTVNESAMYVSFETPDSVKTLYEWYKNAMKDWTLTSEANFGPTAGLFMEKGAEKVNISITADEGKTSFDASGNKIVTGAKTTFIINWSK